MKTGNKKNFSHLHLHTNYSILDGIIKIQDHNGRKGLVSRIKEMGMTSVGLTDHGGMMGAIKLYNECNDQGVLPIIGTEFYIIDGDTNNPEELKGNKTFHITILSKNNAGYRNLIKLNSYAAKHFHRRPKIDYKVLEKYSEGLVCLSGCPSSQIWTAILNLDLDQANRTTELLKRIFGDDFYMELQDNDLELKNRLGVLTSQADINDKLRNLAGDFDCTCCPTSDAHYLYKEDSKAQEVALCIATKANLGMPSYKEVEEFECETGVKAKGRMKFDEEKYFVRSRAEMAEKFPDSELDVTLEIEDKCREEPVHINNPEKNEEDSYFMPSFPTEDGISKEQLFDDKCLSGFRLRYGEKDDFPEYWKRIKHEAKVIKKMGFMDYFLMTSDMLIWAKNDGIPLGPGRGSAAGSLICYCFEITDVCPMEYNLLFERFLNEFRVSLPD